MSWICIWICQRLNILYFHNNTRTSTFFIAQQWVLLSFPNLLLLARSSDSQKDKCFWKTISVYSFWLCWSNWLQNHWKMQNSHQNDQCNWTGTLSHFPFSSSDTRKPTGICKEKRDWCNYFSALVQKRLFQKIFEEKLSMWWLQETSSRRLDSQVFSLFPLSRLDSIQVCSFQFPQQAKENTKSFWLISCQQFWCLMFPLRIFFCGVLKDKAFYPLFDNGIDTRECVTCPVLIVRGWQSVGGSNSLGSDIPTVVLIKPWLSNLYIPSSEGKKHISGQECNYFLYVWMTNIVIFNRWWNIHPLQSLVSPPTHINPRVSCPIHRLRAWEGEPPDRVWVFELVFSNHHAPFVHDLFCVTQ